jgi:uncharacterized membrane protein
VTGRDIKLIMIAAIVFALLDTIWLGFVMRDFYRAELGPISLLAADGSFAPIWAAALPVYVLLAAGVVMFVLPRAASVPTAAGWGALSGFIVFGVYDLTNLSTLRGYSLKLTVADIAWGMFTSATTAAVVKRVQRLMK